MGHERYISLDLLHAMLLHPRVQTHPRGRDVAYIAAFLREHQARCGSLAELIGVWTR